MDYKQTYSGTRPKKTLMDQRATKRGKIASGRYKKKV
jgi:hypothetical protein